MPMKKYPHFVSVLPEIDQALKDNLPLVALESAVITHGLPSPDNLSIAKDMEHEVYFAGVTPATVALFNGEVYVGLKDDSLVTLAPRGRLSSQDILDLMNNHQPMPGAHQLYKISARDIAMAVTKKVSGGTTVAGTLAVCNMLGIKVFATGGIGGVHKSPQYDISADILQLSRTPTIVVCAGAKSILDLRATLELLETFNVPVIGYQTDELPAFYHAHSGLRLSTSAETPQEVARLAQTHWATGQRSAVLVTVPPPTVAALDDLKAKKLERIVEKEAQENKVHGQYLTPFLLSRMAELSQDRSIHANLALLRNNARIAAHIAREMY